MKYILTITRNTICNERADVFLNFKKTFLCLRSPKSFLEEQNLSCQIQLYWLCYKWQTLRHNTLTYKRALGPGVRKKQRGGSFWFLFQLCTARKSRNVDNKVS